MATMLKTQQQLAARTATRAVAPRVRGAVRCNASLQQQAKKAAAAIAAAPVMLAASPAFAIVDERLNGDGTGLPFGVNDPALGWVIVAVAGLVWAVFYASQKDFGDFEDPDSGLDL
ncbi:photosystem II reaction center W [Raphidocelis subcapitata]|uniref:PSII 6.1 kDa protein n=1 Tax=Raphidocelis subcapitata TaxID=307507 RepID=A0A2V0PDY1_9CHLO|nr:photosystem II reaction center W [Raphidocelis subcapitata]|eukprot:GBF98046.1 photosystem II reaction center W [Raphidocelis subcapitata]